jgi:hypothetical protein
VKCWMCAAGLLVLELAFARVLKTVVSGLNFGHGATWAKIASGHAIASMAGAY